MEGREREFFQLLEPIVSSQGVELVELGLGGSRRGTVVQIVIHSPGGVSHGDCARVTRACGEALEDAGTLDGRYTLEVSSPGLARVLKSEREFEVFRGLPVRVQLRDEAGERSGACAGARNGDVVLQDEDGNESVIPWSSVARARLAVEPGRGFGGRDK